MHHSGSSRPPSSQAAGPRPRPAPRTGASTAGPQAAVGRTATGCSTSSKRTVGRQVLIAAGVAVAFLACLVAVLLTARAAAAGGRPLPEPLPVRVQPDPPLSSGRPLVSLPWGSRPGSVGIDPPGEGLRRAPWALAVAADGRIAVLDAVNRRVTTMDAEGSHVGDIPLDLSDPRFLAVDQGSIHVLDPDVDRRLVSVDWAGVPLAGGVLPVLQAPVSGLFCRDGVPYVETAHRDVFALRADAVALDTAIDNPAVTRDLVSEGSFIADRSAIPAPDLRQPGELMPSPVAGRPLRAGGFSTARCVFTPPDSARVTLTPRGAGADLPSLSGVSAAPAAPAPVDSPTADLSVLFPWAVEHLVSLDGDDRGDVIMGARLLRPLDRSANLVVIRVQADSRSDGASAPADQADEAPVLLLEGGGIAETGSPFHVAPDGRVYQPRATDSGYTILLHDFPKE